ncbi:MAG: hypothetical protein H0X25_21110 [Acidobacteriales bacterium]|nr:hypothetical protein [Terriglobales bacterium]
MARINIEECWWSDPRRSKLIKLVGDEGLADARAIRMWRLAQEFWKSGRGLVPQDIFETLEDWEALIKSRLADLRDDGIYVRGSSQYLEWTIAEREKRARGGKTSAARPRDANGRLLPAEVQVNSSCDPSEASNVQVSGSVSVSGSSEFEEEEPAAEGRSGKFESAEHLLSSLPALTKDTWVGKHGPEAVADAVSEAFAFWATDVRSRAWGAKEWVSRIGASLKFAKMERAAADSKSAKGGAGDICGVAD